MKSRYASIAGMVLLAAVCSGCGPSLLDRHRGVSFHSAVCSQTLNPEAGSNVGPVVGLDGRAAAEVMENYRESWETEEKKEASIMAGDTMKGIIFEVPKAKK